MMLIKGVLYPEIPEFYFFYYQNIFVIYNSNMCIYKDKKRKIKKFSGWCATPPNVPKIGVSGVKDTAKTNTD